MRVLTVSFLVTLVSVCQSQEGDQEGGSSGKEFSNFTCTNIDKVEDIQATTENEELSLRWSYSKRNETCPVSYIVNIYDDHNELVHNEKTTNTLLVIGFKFIGCMTYRLTILPVMEKLEGAATEISVAFPKDVKPPTCNVTVVKETSVILTCIFEEDEDNFCEVDDFDIVCDGKIAQNVTVPDNNNYFEVELNNLSEYTNYTCWSALKDIVSETLTFQTKQSIPDSPEIINVSSVTDTSFTIEWNSSVRVRENLTYQVTTEELRPLYLFPEYCNFTSKKYYSDEIDASQFKYTVSNLLPSYEYEVSLRAKTIDYGSASKSIMIQTLGGTPEEPKDVNFVVVNIENPEHRIELNLSWTFPCFANAVIKWFSIEVSGYPLFDHHIGETKETKMEYANNTEYNSLFANLEPAFNYTVLLKSVATNDIESNAVVLNFRTPESYPDPLIINSITNVTSTSFTVEWSEPLRKNGELDGYFIYLFGNRLNDSFLEDCPANFNLDVFKFVLPSQTSFTFNTASPGVNYTIVMYASTKGKNGSNVTFYIHTLDAEPEQVRDLNLSLGNRFQEYYNGSVTIKFKPPCNFNGKFKCISIRLSGSRVNKKPHLVTTNISSLLSKYEYQMEIWAEYMYELTVLVVTENFVKGSKKMFTSPSGIPLLTNYIMQNPIAISSSQAKFNFSKYMFDDSYGDIIYYSIIIGQSPYEEKSLFGYWEGDERTWPVINTDFNNEVLQPHALTPKFWNPFKDNNASDHAFIIKESSMHPNIWYTVKVRGFTKYGYRDSSQLMFKLPENFDISALIFGIIFGILGTIILLGSVFILWRKRRRWSQKKESIKSISLHPIPVSIKNFPQYYSELSNDADKLKQEYMLLINKSNEITLSCSQGLIQQNKKKNRYTNVIAYDHSRVKLNDMDEGDSDYINASYIKGYSGATEYIATQGPLEQTLLDFWKMVIQENSSLIVMVAQFVEQNKDKCYKYFPNNHENMELENGIEIRCCSELDFRTYIVRTLLVQKDLDQWTITHLQFTDWPDFGCPAGTEMMLEFCRLMRDYAVKSDSPIILHCSAGIGRTGTLIALDIILQAINENKDVDIFETVLNLRKDRKNMVQTEKQYLYIHNCINDAIEKPEPPKNCIMEKEPIYENVEEIKKEQNGINVTESIF